ncbi:MAG: SGNH/GDSL hydrolase family protein [Myxacorys chilensis ATA2-1-KO14]|jgi:lysophospholipase L1-like esterase|nr:SGNH/GDSL hydrolase family protein [Myxacorys chilensis ATA2-1-KO14]
MQRSFLIALATALNLITFKLSADAYPPTLDPKSPNELRQQIQQIQQRLEDWAQLEVYRQANATVPPPAVGENRVVFFGDSITDFWDLSTYFPRRPYINRGISGQTTPQMLIRFRPDVVALKPRVVVILAGTNDIAGNTGPMSLDQIEDNYASIAELAKAHQIRVVFASLLPIHDYGAKKILAGRPPAKIEALNYWFKKYCKANHCIHLDYYSHMLDDRGMLRAELSDDGLHPNAKGYNIMAPLAVRAIQQALEQLSP